MLDMLRKRLAKAREMTLEVRVRPGAPVTQFRDSLADGSIKIDLAAPAQDGKANAELLRFLARAFRVPDSSVEICAGAAARRKRVRLILP